MSYLSDKLLVTGYLILLLSGTANAADNAATTEASVNSDAAPLLDVYKSPSCGCCQKWIDHAEHAGFEITAHNTNSCLLYTSDAADDSLRVDLGGRRIIKKK